MRCPRCASVSITLTPVNEVELKKAHHGCWWWTFVGWWWIPVKWNFFTVPALFVRIFIPKKQYVSNKIHTVAVCQNCGYTWKTR